MYYVYVIQSIKNKTLYFGRTDDLTRRLEEHNSGRNTSTKDFLPWKYVYVEGYASPQDASRREARLKQYGNARTYVKKRLHNSLL
jgi:putative endonuclease